MSFDLKERQLLAEDILVSGKQIQEGKKPEKIVIIFLKCRF